ncbi:SAM hydrolase/SAM-dependent halogenase family protein [Dictyobacter aurantiacus]|uniref:SAM-dependent chlorinase/fluorinase n=1 Tax=Dictyobacter aurantiacus TaxID=1936993 RepID=A0A401ZFF7_9CHLR|nr:SAM-dependent chlorinase/fluorinase [Dictyobacter aurantiacus]GCE05620.1 hypothetical protein KDAU_29490 [Dictyobacter aurantiacus]
MQQGTSPAIALLTDFGIRDNFVGVMKGVMTRIAPGTTFIDLTHEIPPQDVSAGAWVLGTAYRYFPAGSVFVCVVDPGVGSTRDAVAIHAGDWYFVGPDNGLFHFVLAEQPVHAAVKLTNPAFHLPTVSATFQGRDLFSPVGAHIAAGRHLLELGEPVPADSLRRLDLPGPVLKPDRIEADVSYVDHFGNLVTSIAFAMLPDFFDWPVVRLLLPAKQLIISERRRFFADQGDDAQPFLYVDSSGYIAIAMRNTSAARSLNIGRGEAVTLIWRNT